MIYFFHDERAKAVKIGWTEKPVEQRRLSIQTAGELILLGTLPGGRDEERKAHAMFAAKRLRGEWFQAGEETLNSIRLLLLDGGSPRTLAEELERREGCRFGLRGVRIAVPSLTADAMEILSSEWDAGENLVLRIASPKIAAMIRLQKSANGGIRSGSQVALESENESVFKNVPAEVCYLLSSWPVVCRCWCEDSEL